MNPLRGGDGICPLASRSCGLLVDAQLVDCRPIEGDNVNRPLTFEVKEPSHLVGRNASLIAVFLLNANAVLECGNGCLYLIGQLRERRRILARRHDLVFKLLEQGRESLGKLFLSRGGSVGSLCQGPERGGRLLGLLRELPQRPLDGRERTLDARRVRVDLQRQSENRRHLTQSLVAVSNPTELRGPEPHAAVPVRSG